MSDTQYLCSLALEIWRNIGRRLDFRSVARLYFTGDSRLLRILTNGGIDLIEVMWGTEDKLNSACPCWVELVHKFSNHLRTFAFRTDQLNTEFNVSTDTLDRLPSQLSNLRLAYDGLESSFWRSESEPFKLGLVCPNLLTLDLWSYAQSSYPNLDKPLPVKYFPQSLLTFRYDPYAQITPDVEQNGIPPIIPELPSGLLMLKLKRVSFNSSAFGILPRGLLWFDASMNKQALQYSDLSLLPPTLTVLKLTSEQHSGFGPREPIANFVYCFPTTLRKLCFAISEIGDWSCLKALPALRWFYPSSMDLSDDLKIKDFSVITQHIEVIRMSSKFCIHDPQDKTLPRIVVKGNDPVLHAYRIRLDIAT